MIPTCFPLAAAVRHEVAAGALGRVAVMVEERSRCAVDGSGAVLPPPRPGADVVGVDRLRALVAVQGDGLWYEVVWRADGWLVAPVASAGPRVVDTRVDVDGSAEDPQSGLLRSLTLRSGVGFAAATNPNGGTDVLPPAPALVDTPFVEAWRALWVGREQVPVGFVIEVDPKRPTDPRPWGRITELWCWSCG